MLRTIILLATLACAEGETTNSEDRRAIVATVVNRAVANSTTIEEEIRRPGQYADLSYCAGGTQLIHVINAVRGFVGIGLPAWWSPRVSGFVAPYALARVEERWTRRGLVKRGRVPRGHVYFERIE